MADYAPYRGLKVADLSQGLAGPYCAMQLAAYGADVVNFFFAHPYGTQPSPYAAGLPEGLPSDCSL